jgi:tRNA-2-methylthio-N6-dimethylallyladenosine synthase
MPTENTLQQLQDWSQHYTEIQGRPPRMFFATFGCQMSFNDAELIAGLLDRAGFVKHDLPEESDLVILNTCSVRESAENRVLGHLGKLKFIKEQHPNLIIALGGCMVQRPEIVAKVQKSYRHVDILFGTHQMDAFPELLWQVLQHKGKAVDIRETNAIPEEGLPKIRGQKHLATVSITYGCNNFCTYCIVPHVRGRERSRNPEDIIAEIRDLVVDGVKEVTLLGQNVNSYGKGLEPNIDFADLLKQVNLVEGIARIRFMSSHPRDVTARLIQVFKESIKVCPQFHLPLQSGSSRILHAMNRGYTKERYLEIAQQIRLAVPKVAFTTDIIVGFPGETDEDFEDTLDVIRKVRFDSAYTFIYSQRSGTPAADMDNQIPYAIKQARIQRLMEIQADISLEINQECEGRDLEVLVEGPSKQDPLMNSGRSEGNKLVHFPAENTSIGELVTVRIEKASSWHLEGKRV